MQEILSIIDIIGVVGAVVISTITLFTTRSLQRSQQKVSVMAKKRSARIDLMREYSAGIISSGKQILFGVDDVDTKRNLISYVDKFNSLLQYEYIHDVELINCANDIVQICFEKVVDVTALKEKLTTFWSMCDVYVGVEYERLKNESMGDINGSGKVHNETKTFEDIYKVLSEQQNKYTSQK